MARDNRVPRGGHRRQRDHEKFLAVLQLFRESPEAMAWAVLLGGAGITALLSQMMPTQPMPQPEDNDWMSVFGNALIRGLAGPWTLALPAGTDLTNIESWQGLAGAMAAGGVTGVAAMYLILSAASGGARQGDTKGGGALGAVSGLLAVA